MRTQSLATQLRHSRSEAKIQAALSEDLWRELRKRRQCGQMMSNLCFNLSQNEAYDPTHRQSMKDCREMWDSITKVR